MSQAKDTVETAGTSAPDLVALFTAIAKSLVDAPDEVEVEAFPEDDATVLEVVVAPEDVTRLIGKGGRTARALRTILAAASEKLDGDYELDIIEDDDDEDEIDEDDDNRGNRA
jgi:predicted RNA-binding protein YlqC (UPF0109 family)